MEQPAVECLDQALLAETAQKSKVVAILGEGSPGEEKLRPLSLKRVPWAWCDRLMPGEPRAFLIAVAAMAAAIWVIGFTLSPSKTIFVASPEWQVTPFFMAVHFICLRLFVTCYTRNFLAAASHLDMPPAQAVRWVRNILGRAGGSLALALAIPLCVMNYFYLMSDKYAEWAAFDGGAVGPCSYFLWFLWCMEWLLNAYIWVLLAGFSIATLWALRRFRFRASIEVLLHEKQYRPFLMMSAQGASIVMFFGLVNVFYVWYADGELSDYIGLGITGGLLLMGFGPPWLQLKTSVEEAVNREAYRLQEKLVAGIQRSSDRAQHDTTIEDLGHRLDIALSILHTGYLERMQRELGSAEGKAVLLKLLVPASTVGWKMIRPWLGI